VSLITVAAPARLGARGHPPLRRIAWWALVIVAVAYALGDIAEISPANTALLTGVHALAPVAIVLTLVSGVWSRDVVAIPTGVVVSGVTWLAVLTLSAALAPTYQADALGALSRTVTGLLLAWTVCQLCASRTRWLKLAQALASGGLLIAILGLAETAGLSPVQDWLASLQAGDVPIGDVPRLAATLSHPNEAAILLELSLPLVIAWSWSSSGRWRSALLTAATATLAAIVLTFSRAGLISALVGLGVLAIVAVRAHEGPRRFMALGIVVLIVPLTLGWAALSDPGLDRRLLAGLDESSAMQPARSEFWSVAIQMAHDRPLLGVGPDNFRWRFGEYSGLQVDNLGIHAHNQYLEALADTGVLGFLAFAGFIGVVVRLAAKRSSQSHWRAALLASLIAWLTHALLDDFERFWPASIAFWLMVGLISSV